MNMKTSLLLIIMGFFPLIGFGQVPTLRTVSNFILFTSNGALTNTGVTQLGGGSIGTNLGGIVGFDDYPGFKHIQDIETNQCKLDLMALFLEITNLPITRTITTTDLPLHGIYTAGIYSIGEAVTMGLTLTLDAQNNPDAIFIFKVTGAFSAAAGTKILLTNGALAKNIFFNVDGAISFGAEVSMKGNFLSMAGAIAMAAGAKLEGRALTNSGAVSLNQNLVMSAYTTMPVFTLIQPSASQTTGTITVVSPRQTGMSYSLDGVNFSNTNGIFTSVPPGSYILTAKDSIGSISAGAIIKIVPFLNLGVTSDFAIFTNDGDIVSLGDSTQITGNVGNGIGDIDFSLGILCGQQHSGDSMSKLAAADLVSLKNDLAKSVCDSTIGTVFGNGQILTPKVYCFGAALILDGDLILDARGDPNAQFIFKITGAFQTAVNSKVILRNSASMCNVYWLVTGAITIHDNSEFRGNIVCTGAIIFENGSTLQGRALSTAGAITLNDNVRVNILPSPTITLIQPTTLGGTGTIIITAPTGLDISYSIDGINHDNTTGIFNNVVQGIYNVTARNTECSSCPGTTVIIAPPFWTGSVNRDWNNAANWRQNAVPIANQDITIPTTTNSPILGPGLVSAAICNNLTIELGAVFTIFPGNILTVKGIITNKAGVMGLIIKASTLDGVPNGSLIFHNSYNDSVQATVEMYSKASWDKTQPTGSIYRWQFLGIPVRSVIANPTFDGSIVRQMCENVVGTTKRWVALSNSSVLTPFTGYEIVQPSATTYTFQGQLINSNYNSGKLSYTSTATYKGEHLIANSYTAAIDIKQIVFGSSDPLVMENTVYLFNTGSLSDWTNNGSGGTGSSLTTTPGQYTSVPQNNAGDGGIPAQVPSMQGFTVVVKKDDPTATVSFPYSSSGTVVKNTDKQRVSKNAQTKPSDKIYSIFDVKGTSYNDKLWIFTEPTCSHSFDNGWDGPKSIGTALAPQIYAMESDGNYQVNTVDDINNTEIGFQKGGDVNYMLTVTHQNLGMKYGEALLVDLLQNKTIDITQSGTQYQFESLEGDAIKRFKIVTNQGEITGTPKIDQEELRVFSSGKTIFIRNYMNNSGELILYDVAGIALQRLRYIPYGISTFNTNLAAGIYILKGLSATKELTKNLILP